MPTSEHSKATALLEAQNKAQTLFHEVEAQKIIHPGSSETRINEQVYSLAQRMYGIEQYWHKRIVRSGSNTLLPYDDNPPDLIVQEDDVVFLDLGPVFEAWEADFGRTFVLGDDPLKHKLCRDIETAFAQGKKYFHEQPDITGRDLYRYVQVLAEQLGWEFGGPIAGHLIGQFPHERIPGDKITFYVHPENPNRMRQPNSSGEERHWILEIHFVDRARRFGGFYEELLTI
jgi:Xaa-Pro aminopeptidase